MPARDHTIGLSNDQRISIYLKQGGKRKNKVRGQVWDEGMTLWLEFWLTHKQWRRVNHKAVR